MLPTETVLLHEFGVSRHTVRAALHHLIIDGLIERRAGRGTTMAKGTSRAEWSIEVIEDLIDIGFASHHDVRSAKFAPFGRRVDAPYVPSKDLATLRR